MHVQRVRTCLRLMNVGTKHMPKRLSETEP